MIVTLIAEAAGPRAEEVDRLAQMLVGSKVNHRLVDADSPEGISLSQLYDITRRPAVVVTQDDGVLVQLWQGQLPPSDELAYSARG